MKQRQMTGTVHGLEAAVCGHSNMNFSAVANVLESAQFVLGSEVAAFENVFAAFCGSELWSGL